MGILEALMFSYIRSVSLEWSLKDLNELKIVNLPLRCKPFNLAGVILILLYSCMNVIPNKIIYDLVSFRYKDLLVSLKFSSSKTL